MKVLITGASGFIGSKLVEKLESKGYEVYGLGPGCVGNMRNNYVNGYITFENLDIIHSFADKDFDVIYHLAGSGSVSIANSEPYLSFNKTVNSTAILLDWIRGRSPDSRIIVTSSAAVYGVATTSTINELSPVNPCSIYGEHKALVEQMARSYANKFNLKVTSARLFSVYGSGLKKQLLWDVSNRILSLKKGDTLECFGTGYECRDWIHVDDVCDALGRLVSKDLEWLEVVNIGTGKSNTVSYIIDLLLENLGFKGKIEVVFNGKVRLGDPHSLVANNLLYSAMDNLDYLSLEQGVADYVNWLQNEDES